MTMCACLSLSCMRARVCVGSCSDSDENEEDIDQGDGRSSRSLPGGKQPQCSGEPPEQLVLLIHHLLLVPRGRGGVGVKFRRGGALFLVWPRLSSQGVS